MMIQNMSKLSSSVGPLKVSYFIIQFEAVSDSLSVNFIENINLVKFSVLFSERKFLISTRKDIYLSML